MDRLKFVFLSVFIFAVIIVHIMFMIHTRQGVFFGSEWFVYVGLCGVLVKKGCDWLCKE